MTDFADVSCVRCHEGYWISRADVVPFTCDDCAETPEPASLLHDPGDLPKAAVWLGLGAFLALVAIVAAAVAAVCWFGVAR